MVYGFLLTKVRTKGGKCNCLVESISDSEKGGLVAPLPTTVTTDIKRRNENGALYYFPFPRLLLLSISNKLIQKLLLCNDRSFSK